MNRFVCMWNICVYPWIFYIAGIRWHETAYLIASLVFSLVSFSALSVVAWHDARVRASIPKAESASGDNP